MTDRSPTEKVAALTAELLELDRRREAIGAELVGLQFSLDADAKILAASALHDDYFGRLFALADRLREDSEN
jgi:hypothetical protein